ncbi:hypothetical protein V7S43_018950 [Phytophthora oleae]|uniref:Uncharacterized protein n=1 Tax=Phytophthora oleae TaxID=2107226 RepID=A0ABD3EPY7_9STRA
MNAGVRGKPYHSLLGWLAMASWAAEDDMNTCNIESSVDVIVSTEAHLFRVAWNLLSQDIKIDNVKSGNCDSHLCNSRYKSFDSTSGYPLLVRSIDEDLSNDPLCARVLENYGGMLASRQDALENFYIASLLLKMLAGSTSDSRSRVVGMAVQSICALDDSKLEVFACYLLSKTTPTDMSPNCIPFLVRYFRKIRNGSAWTFTPLSYMNLSYEYIYVSRCPVFSDDNDYNECSKCLNRLAYLWRDSKAQIEKYADIVQQMRENKLIDDEE